MRSKQREELRARLIDGLHDVIVQTGWEVYPRSQYERVLATLDVETAVGPKTTVAYMSDFGDGFQITGVYHSEGRNILEPCFVILAGNELRDAEAAFVEFSLRAQAARDQSYARGLYLRNEQDPASQGGRAPTPL